MTFSGQTAKFWTPESRKVVGVPRFELGTPCTPCRSSLARKYLIRRVNSARRLSRIADSYGQLSLCFGRAEPSDSGRSLAPGDLITYRHCEGDRPAEYVGRYGALHLLTISVHGSRGRGLRYVSESDFSAGDPLARQALDGQSPAPQKQPRQPVAELHRQRAKALNWFLSARPAPSTSTPEHHHD
jgi:hypothetical protein